MLRRLLNRLSRYRAHKHHGQESSYEDRLKQEQAIFADNVNVHDLPDIFHYWSNAYLLPMFTPFGFSNPYEYFYIDARKLFESKGDKPVRMASIGTGNGEMEVYVAERLRDDGFENFTIDCLEINQDMIGRMDELAASKQVSGFINGTRQDFNRWMPEPQSYDVIMANQSLHHVTELEHLFDAIATGLKPNGRFLTSDMIGRNGHQRWPEALDVVNEFWKELPEAYRTNQLLRRKEMQYINHDCSSEGFEGIRAQDILPLLVDRFRFELFVPFGNAVFVFIDRPFGHNFDDQGAWDLDFIDRVHAADEQGFMDGSLKPTSMIASLALSPVETRLRHPKLTPEFCIREP